MTEADRNPLHKESGVSIRPSFPQLRRSAMNMIPKQVGVRARFHDRNRVPLIEGVATILDPNTVVDRGNGMAPQRIRAAGIVAAVGSHPHRPANVAFTHPRIFDSDTIPGRNRTPKSITVYGAGVVGRDCASTSATCAAR